MSSILSRIRKTLGEDALILSTRKKKKNGLGAFTEEVYEVSAAVDRSAAVASPASARRFIPPAYRAPVGPVMGPLPTTSPATTKRSVSAPAPEETAPEAPTTRASAPFDAFLSLEKELLPLKEEIRSLKGFMATIAEEQAKQGTGERKDRMAELAHEVRSLHDLLKSGAAPGVETSSPTSAVAAPASPKSPSPRAIPAGAAVLDGTATDLDWLTRRLSAQGVEPSLRDRILQAALARRPGQDRVTEEDLRREAGVVIETSIRAGKLPSPRNNGPRILAFVGPPGSGKTETVRRAARMLADRGTRVAVITVDDAATGTEFLYESLQRPLGIPVLHASDGETLSRAVATCFGAGYILIDVSGSALRDREAVRRLFGMFQPHAGIDFCLTLPADWKGPRADRIAERLSPFRMGYLAFTKIDRTKRYGGILNAAAGSNLPVLFLSAGELIPARSYMFSRLLLGNRHPEQERPTI